MYKTVMSCSECQFFEILRGEIMVCNNKRGLPFPSGSDFCSNAVEAETAKNIFSDKELLSRVYQQRRASN